MSDKFKIRAKANDLGDGWIELDGWVNPPQPPLGWTTEVKRDCFLGLVTHYRFVRKDNAMFKKFKIGDTVRTVVELPHIPLGTTLEVIDVDSNFYLVESSKEHWVEGDYLELTASADVYQSPVKERVVKEIVAGRYGHFTVGTTDSMNRVHVVQGDSEMFTTQDLRHAARVFNNLAEALEEK